MGCIRLRRTGKRCCVDANGQNKKSYDSRHHCYESRAIAYVGR